ncbi:MAG: helix-turn-helix domain-containing protein [Ramlibacter sp.]|nr:helix-turn-helix domain-containing protein [Ramlibacter sp.]
MLIERIAVMGLIPAAEAAGINRQTARKWRQRFEQGGEEALHDCSSRPDRTRSTVDTELGQRIQRSSVQPPRSAFHGNAAADRRHRSVYVPQLRNRPAGLRDYPGELHTVPGPAGRTAFLPPSRATSIRRPPPVRPTRNAWSTT